MRLIVALIFVVAILLPQRSGAEQLHPCARKNHTFAHIREHTNERVRAHFAEAVEKAGMNVQNFAVCDYDDVMPTIALLTRLDDGSDVFAILLPRFVDNFTKAELDGVFGHELGHIPTYWQDRERKGIQLEVDIDEVGAKWFGKDAIIAMLNAMIRESARFHPMAKGRAVPEFRHRISVLSKQ